MTRAPRPVRNQRPVRDPYGLLPAGTPIAAVLAVAGLLMVGLVTVVVGSGQLPFNVGVGPAGPGPGGSGDPGVVRTPTPSNEVVVPTEPPGLVIPGTLVYAKEGNIWVQTDGKATQVTDGGNDSMPSFAQDGTAIYFVRTRETERRLERRRRDQGLHAGRAGDHARPGRGRHADEDPRRARRPRRAR